MRTALHRGWSLLVAGTAVALLAGCGGGSTPPAASAPPPSLSASPAPVIQEVTATITETAGPKYAIAFSPSEVTAGMVQLTLNNQSKIPQDLQIIRREGGHKFEEFAHVLASDEAPIPSWVGIPGGVGTVAPGQKGTAVLQLKAGEHTYFSSSGEDSDAYKKGAVGDFSVKACSGCKLAPLPATTATVEMVGKDNAYRFKVSDLKAGDNTVLMDNTTPEPHHLLAVPIKGSYTIDEVKKEFASDGNAPPKTIDFERAASTAVVDGESQMVGSLMLERGRYALICFISDRKGGKPHAMEGMLQETTIR